MRPRRDLAAQRATGARAAVAGLALLVACGADGRACADDSGGFVVCLGQDTTGVEQYTRTPARLEVNQVGRTPRVMRRQFTYEFVDGAPARFAMTATPAGGATPTQTIAAGFVPDSVRVRIESGSQVQNLVVAIPAGTAVVTNTSPWVGYEGQIMKLVQSGRDRLRAPLWFVGSASTNWLDLATIGGDSVAITTDRGDVYHARVDRAGRILGVRPVAGPAQYSVQRVAKLDLEAMAADYTAREAGGAGLGVLSPRDTVRVAAGGASLTIDYGRPAKRGRAIFGRVVPYGEVWRTGANAATQLRTDKALDFGGTIVPAGFYTLWTLPTASGWKLIVNGETGQWGTARVPARDLYTIEMQVTTLPRTVERFTIAVEPAPRGGVLALEWDTTRAAAAFAVQP
jgi:hypothetical protein